MRVATAQQVHLEEEGPLGGAGRVAGVQGSPSFRQAWQVLPPGASTRSPGAGPGALATMAPHWVRSW